MKNKLIQFVVILFAFIIIPINSNSQTRTKKKVVANSQTRTKKKVVTTSKPEPSREKKTKPVTKNRIFKGALRYAVFSYSSKAAQKYSHSQSYSGTSLVTKLINGNKIHIFNEITLQHTIIDIDNDKYCVYSDLTKEGYCYKWSDFKNSAYGLEYKLGSMGWKGKEQVSYKKDPLIRSTCNFTIQGTSYIGESWWSEAFILAPIMNLLQGDCVKGIERRRLWEANANINVGVVRTVQAEELLEIYEYDVVAEDFEIPSEITIITSKKYASYPLLNMGSVINEFNKHQEKAMKKWKLVDKKNQEEAISLIQQEWPNVTGTTSAERKSKSVFRLVVEGYGVDNLGNDISNALIQTSEALRPQVSQVTVSGGADMDDSKGRQSAQKGNELKPRKTVRDVVNTRNQNFANASSDARCYRRYVDMLIGCKYGGVPACDPHERTKIQKEMREIRERNEKKGIWKIGKSEWEDWDGK